MRTVCLLLLIAITSYGQAVFRSPSYVGSFTSTAAVAPSYLISEDCEGTGTPSGWTKDASFTFDDTMAIEGSQSAYSPVSSQTAYKTFSAQTNVYFYAQMWSTNVVNGTLVMLFSGDAGSAGGVRIDTDGSGSFFHGSWNYNRMPAGTWKTNQNIHLWVQYTKGTGANGVLKAWYSSTATKPGSPTGTWTAGTSTIDVTKLTLYGPLKIDHIRVSASDIGSNPP